MKFLISIIMLSFISLHAQGIDSLILFKADTLRSSFTDTVAVNDTTQKRTYDIDTVIYATASDSLIFFVKSKKMSIFGTGELKYKQTSIKSANIYVDFQTSNIDAEGITDDSTGALKGTPVLTEKSEVYKGTKMKYNFKTAKGFISVAKTEQDGSYYTGEKIKKVDRLTYFIENGIYTTCDDSCPHYYFTGSEMKVIHKEQIVAKWIFLHFGGVPFPIPLPFGLFPIESGRRSGIIPPAFGNDATYGKYFSRFGYFWAISDYMDWNITGDYYTRGSYSVSSRFRYTKRYDFSGDLFASYESLVRGERTDADRSENNNWRLMWNHNQEITPTLRFDARLEFLSGNTLQRNITDFNQILRNEILSNASLHKTWDESGNSMSISYQRRQVIESGDISEVLPQIIFTKSQAYPFKREGVSSDQKWYELIGYNYSGQFENRRNKVEGNLQIRGGIQHNINLGFSPKIGYFSIAPNIRYQERWYNKRIEQFSVPAYNGTDSLITNDINEINFVRTFSMGVTASTKFYGMFQPNILGVSALRHTVNPSISYNFTPDFSKPFWGYFDSYRNVSGDEVRYNKFQREIFGGPSTGEQQNISFSLSNIFEIKTAVDPTDTTARENKIQLLNVNGGISYNFAADSIKFSDINLSYRTQIGQYLNLNGNSTFTLYDQDTLGRKINRFLIDQGKGLARLSSFGFSISTTLSGEKLKSTETEKTDTISGEKGDGMLSNRESVYQGLYSDEEPDFTIPWDISLNYNYSESRPRPGVINKVSNMSGSFNFNLTPTWKFSVTGSYDFQRKEFAAPQIRISKDLHCWIMDFSWNPIGTFTGYRFEIRVKAPQLQDLKVTKQDQFYEGR
ncbi:MAG: LPS-assembly protein LptD [Ignavibacteriaceae bacterium]|nr:LPS-assembly protein LptD [Ignavibacteriaceae bacterium]